MIKKLTFTTFFFLVLLNFSCTKENIHDIKHEKYNYSVALSESKAQNAFAIILSKALVEEPMLRNFIKDKALHRVDNDFDVFYPFVKDEIVKDGKTFRELLKKYDKLGQLDQIEVSLPLLTMFIPDWYWINKNCFSVLNWDTTSNEITTACKEGDSNKIFYNGKYINNLPNSEYPSFGVVIIKNNSRIRIAKSTTRTPSIEYEFIRPEYDGRNNPKTTRWTQDWDYSADGNSDFYESSLLDDSIKEARKEFGTTWNSAAQRDYIYYGMSKTNTNHGKIKNYMKEKLLRFKIEGGAAGAILDEGDPQFNTEVVRWRDKNTLSGNDIQSLLWGATSLDIRLSINYGVINYDEKNPFSNITTDHTFMVRPQQLWELTKSSVKKEFRFFDFLKNKYTYYNDIQDLVPKWYYPNPHVEIGIWDLSKISSKIYFSASEHDDNYTKSVTETFVYDKSMNFKIDSNSEVSIDMFKTSLGLNFSYDNKKSNSKSETITFQHISNYLGSNYFSYDYPIIISDEYEKDGKKGYDLKSISTGVLTLTIVPHNINNK